MFADDCFLFCKATLNEVDKTLSVFEHFCSLSGESINKSKSEIFFSQNLHHKLKKVIAKSIKMPFRITKTKYLGIVFDPRKPHIYNCNNILEKVRNKTQNWCKNFISQAGRVTLLKSNIQSIPTYFMQTNILTMKDSENFDKEYKKFLLHNGDSKAKGKNQHKKCPINWNIMCLKKSMGGLGIRNTKNHNLAMFGKLVWRMVRNPNLIWSRMLKEKYFPHKFFFETKSKSSDSSFWKKLVKVKDLFLHNFCWDLRNPNVINIWEEPWIPTLCWLKPFGPRPRAPNIKNVSDLLLPNTLVWNQKLLFELFLPLEVEAIQKIKLKHCGGENQIIWLIEKNGIFSVKSAYNWLQMEDIKRKNLKLPKGLW